jgi:hypothetical protein
MSWTLRFEALTLVTMTITLFWDVMTYLLIYSWYNDQTKVLTTQEACKIFSFQILSGANPTFYLTCSPIGCSLRGIKATGAWSWTLTSSFRLKWVELHLHSSLDLHVVINFSVLFNNAVTFECLMKLDRCERKRSRQNLSWYSRRLPGSTK